MLKTIKQRRFDSWVRRLNSSTFRQLRESGNQKMHTFCNPLQLKFTRAKNKRTRKIWDHWDGWEE